MDKILFSVKTDRTLKLKAQQVARELGLPLGTVVNAYLREFVREKRVVFSLPPMPNARTQKLLKRIREDIQHSKNASRPLTHKEGVRYLDEA